MDSLSLDRNGHSDHKPDNITVGERLSALLAMELLYPSTFHDHDYQKISEGKLSIKRIALRWNIPPMAVSWAHQDDYRKISMKFRSK